MDKSRAEFYPHYERILDQSVNWLSESSSHAAIRIDGMARPYAYSAYQKLLRWARTPAAYHALGVFDIGERLSLVANSKLARALADRTEGLIHGEGEEPVAREVTPREMILVFVPLMAERVDLDIKQVFEICEEMATRADELWTITAPSR